MIVKYLSLLLLITVSTRAAAQKPIRIFFNESWQQVDDSNKATYYRVVDLDGHGKPRNPVSDYYKSGKLQWRGNLKFSGPADYAKGTIEGLSTYYYESGRKSHENTRLNGEIEGHDISWYENGSLQEDSWVRHGKMEGKRTGYYENGNVKYSASYRNNRSEGLEIYNYADGRQAARNVMVAGRPATGDCYDMLDDEQVLLHACYHRFTDTAAGWKSEANGGTIKAEAADLILMQAPSRSYSINYISANKRADKLKGVGVYLSFSKGINSAGQLMPGLGSGIAFNIIDEKNFFFFSLDPAGNCCVGSVADGQVSFRDTANMGWEKVAGLNKDGGPDLVWVFFENDKLQFTVNGELCLSAHLKLVSDRVGLFSYDGMAVRFKDFETTVQQLGANIQELPK